MVTWDHLKGLQPMHRLFTFRVWELADKVTTDLHAVVLGVDDQGAVLLFINTQKVTYIDFQQELQAGNNGLPYLWWHQHAAEVSGLVELAARKKEGS